MFWGSLEETMTAYYDAWCTYTFAASTFDSVSKRNGIRTTIHNQNFLLNSITDCIFIQVVFFYEKIPNLVSAWTSQIEEL
jgi:hypothetical protein